jgi:hypothetical protein
VAADYVNDLSSTLIQPLCYWAEPGSRARRSATFLPEVASHEGWSVSETLEHLIRKAGYQGNATDVLSGIEVSQRIVTMSLADLGKPWLRKLTAAFCYGN